MSSSSSSSCACLKGVRSCAICRPDLFQKVSSSSSAASIFEDYIHQYYSGASSTATTNSIYSLWCPECRQLFRVEDHQNDDDGDDDKKAKKSPLLRTCKDHSSSCQQKDDDVSIITDDELRRLGFKPFHGVAVVPDFMSQQDEDRIVQFLDHGAVSSSNKVSDESTITIDAEIIKKENTSTSSSPAWQASQSGRRKVDFGPRANFKQRKAQSRSTFTGFPAIFKEMNSKVERVVTALSSSSSSFSSSPPRQAMPWCSHVECSFGYRFTCNKGMEVPDSILKQEGDCSCGGNNTNNKTNKHLASTIIIKTSENEAAATTTTRTEVVESPSSPINHQFTVAEIAALDYQPSVCSNLDPHQDDAWIWGARIVGISLLSDSAMTFVQHQQQVVEEDTTKKPDENQDDGNNDDDDLEHKQQENQKQRSKNMIIVTRIPLPRRALFVMSDATRYHWLHGINAKDIRERRVSLTIRELAREFVKDEPELAREFLNTAKKFV